MSGGHHGMSVEEARKLPPFTGGQRAMMIAAVVGIAGLALTAARAFVGEDAVRTALFSYLLAFVYWFAIGMGALVLLLIFRASHASWAIVVRRVVEVMAGTVPIFALLFVPIALGYKQLYPWAAPTESMGEEALKLFHHRAPYLNVPFFFARVVVYFVLWSAVSRLLLAWSSKQDTVDDPNLTRRSWALGAGALPAVGVTLSFAAFDWLMSLSTLWYSSMFGVYYFAGGFIACLSLLVMLLVFLDRSPSFHGVMRVAHWLSLGKFMLAFTCFWAYVSFSQYMLTWVANLPDSTGFMIARQEPHWHWLGRFLIVGHFALPFMILLGRGIKMKPTRLATLGLWMLFMHFVDLYWVVMPQVRPTQWLPDWANVTALAGVGGVAIAFGLFTLRGKKALPVGDPFLADSLGYEKML
jgi:hypothetical protein